MAAPISTTYDAQERAIVIEWVLSQVASGESVAGAFRSGKEAGIQMPALPVFWIWHLKDEQLQTALARARLNGVEVHMEDIVDIADEANADAYVDYAKDGTAVARIDGEAIARSKLKIEARIKRAQMIAPRKYGPKLDMTSDGKALNAGELTPEQRAARLNAIVAMARIKPAKVIEHRPSRDDLLS